MTVTGDLCGTTTGAKIHRAHRQPLCGQCASHLRTQRARIDALLTEPDSTWRALFDVLSDVMTHPDRYPKDRP